MFSILIPVYDEIDTLKEIIKQVSSVNIDKEIIIVDDCSDDGSKEFLKSYIRDNPGLKVIFQEKNYGKGAAIRTALFAASGEYSIIQDADLEYNPQDYILLTDIAKKCNADVVYGSRFLKTWKSTSFLHFLVNKFLTVLTNLLFHSRLSDMETCYKMIRTGIFKDLNIESNRFEIEAEITAKLLKKGYDIIEVPISYKGRSYHEGKKITWKDGIATIIALFKYKFVPRGTKPRLL